MCYIYVPELIYKLKKRYINNIYYLLYKDKSFSMTLINCAVRCKVVSKTMNYCTINIKLIYILLVYWISSNQKKLLVVWHLYGLNRFSTKSQKYGEQKQKELVTLFWYNNSYVYCIFCVWSKFLKKLLK